MCPYMHYVYRVASPGFLFLNGDLQKGRANDWAFKMRLPQATRRGKGLVLIRSPGPAARQSGNTEQYVTLPAFGCLFNKMLKLY